jgi:hypothetical protein
MSHLEQNLRQGCLMALPMQQISPVAHLPLVLGVVRKLVMLQICTLRFHTGSPNS